jgi:hypothetical protein
MNEKSQNKEVEKIIFKIDGQIHTATVIESTIMPEGSWWAIVKRTPHMWVHPITLEVRDLLSPISLHNGKPTETDIAKLADGGNYSIVDLGTHPSPKFIEHFRNSVGK